QVANAQAAYALQQVTDARTQELVRTGIVAKQDADQTRSALKQAEATLAQLRATQAYEHIRAPFTGVVTARNFDPGALVPQATTTSGTPIVTIASVATVRVYAAVPQSVAPLVQVGDAAEVSVDEYPGRVFKGTINRRAEALRTATRTMLVEVDVPNPD